MRTFSEIVDTAIATSNMPSHLKYAISACNSIIHEIAGVSLNDYDLDEYSLLVTDTPVFTRLGRDYGHPPAPKSIATWTVPFDFKAVKAVHYGGPIPNGEFVEKREPGRIQENSNKYWYQTGETIVLSGAYGRVDISYYKISKTFVYIKVDKRLLASNDETYYQIRENADESNIWHRYNSDNVIHREIFNRHVNWVIKNHAHTVLEGLLARLYNTRGDLQRGGRHYQQYQAARLLVTNSLNAHLQGQI
jgi:hypothetical protein